MADPAKRRYDMRRIRSSLLRLVLCNDVRTEFTIHVRNDDLVLSGRLQSPKDMSSNSPQFVVRNGSNFVPDILSSSSECGSFSNDLQNSHFTKLS